MKYTLILSIRAGGVTAEGCRQILADFGITEESVGAPIKSDMDVVKLGTTEGGICKLSTIGLGRHVGCTSLHKGGTLNFSTIIPQAAKVVFDKGNIGFAIGIVENAYDRVKLIEGMTRDEVFDREPELLKIAKASMPSIGIPEIDILVIEEIGKDISGFGMDPNIVGLIGPKAEEPSVPKIGKVIVLRLSEKSHGNACGIGLADLTNRVYA